MGLIDKFPTLFRSTLLFSWISSFCFIVDENETKLNHAKMNHILSIYVNDSANSEIFDITDQLEVLAIDTFDSSALLYNLLPSHLEGL